MTSNNLPSFISPIHHDEFLPRISPWMTFGGSALVSTVGIAILICAFTPLPVTIKGQGLVRPIGDHPIHQQGNR